MYMTECVYQLWVSQEDGRRQSKTGTVICPVTEAQALINKFKRGDLWEFTDVDLFTLTKGQRVQTCSCSFKVYDKRFAPRCGY